MEQERPMESEVPVEERKPYRKPELVEYGRVGDLTQGGAYSSTTQESAFYVLTSP